MVLVPKGVFIECKGTFLRADGLARILGETVQRSYGYDAIFIIPFLLLLKLKDAKSVPEAQRIFDWIRKEVWLDGDIEPVVNSLNEIGGFVGIKQTVSPDGTLLIGITDLEKLKRLAEELRERICNLVNPPFDKEKARYLAVLTDRPKETDFVLKLD